MMTGVYNIVDISVTQKEEIVKEDGDFFQIYIAFERFKSDFAQIYSPLYSVAINHNIEGKENYEDLENGKKTNTPEPNDMFPRVTWNQKRIPKFFNEDKSDIAFLTSSNKRKIYGIKESRYGWVRYKLESDPDYPVKGLNKWVRNRGRAKLNQ